MVEFLDRSTGGIDVPDYIIDRMAKAIRRPVEIALTHGEKDLDKVVPKILAERLELANRLEQEKLARKRRYDNFSTDSIRKW